MGGIGGVGMGGGATTKHPESNAMSKSKRQNHPKFITS